MPDGGAAAGRRGGGAAAEHGARLVVVNAEPAPYDALADEVVGEPIGTALPELLRGLRGLRGLTVPPVAARARGRPRPSVTRWGDRGAPDAAGGTAGAGGRPYGRGRALDPRGSSRRGKAPHLRHPRAAGAGGGQGSAAARGPRPWPAGARAAGPSGPGGGRG